MCISPAHQLIKWPLWRNSTIAILRELLHAIGKFAKYFIESMGGNNQTMNQHYFANDGKNRRRIFEQLTQFINYFNIFWIQRGNNVDFSVEANHFKPNGIINVSRVWNLIKKKFKAEQSAENVLTTKALVGLNKENRFVMQWESVSHEMLMWKFTIEREGKPIWVLSAIFGENVLNIQNQCTIMVSVFRLISISLCVDTLREAERRSAYRITIFMHSLLHDDELESSDKQTENKPKKKKSNVRDYHQSALFV